MGFFSGVGKLFRGAGRLIGRGVEKVGEWTGSEKLQEVGRSIQYSCEEVSKKTGNFDTYDKDIARVDETERINKILSDFSISIEKKADEIEETAIRESKVYFESLIKDIYDSEINSEINIKEIKKEMKNIEKSIRGNLKKYIARRVSIDDRACLEILKLEAGQDKEKKMKKFAEDILKKGSESLVDDVKVIIDEEQETINNSIQDKLDEIKFDISKKIEMFNVLEENQHKDTQRESIIIEQAKKDLLLCEKIINVLN